MNDSELDDFKKEVVRKGYEINDFELKKTDLTDWNGSQVVNTKGTITVTRKSTKKQNTYNCGNATHWVIDFLKDLESGYYGSK